MLDISLTSGLDFIIKDPHC